MKRALTVCYYSYEYRQPKCGIYLNTLKFLSAHTLNFIFLSMSLFLLVELLLNIMFIVVGVSKNYSY